MVSALDTTVGLQLTGKRSQMEVPHIAVVMIWPSVRARSWHAFPPHSSSALNQCYRHVISTYVHVYVYTYVSMVALAIRSACVGDLAPPSNLCPGAIFKCGIVNNFQNVYSSQWVS